MSFKSSQPYNKLSSGQKQTWDRYIAQKNMGSIVDAQRQAARESVLPGWDATFKKRGLSRGPVTHTKDGMEFSLSDGTRVIVPDKRKVATFNRKK